MAGDRTLKVTILGDAKGASSAIVELESKTGSFGDKVAGVFGRVGEMAAGFTLGAGLSEIPGKLMEWAKVAADDAASTDRVKQAVENADGSWEKYADRINDAITQGQKLAFSDDDTRNALALLTAETGSTDEALRRLSVAQDLARGTGMDLGTASKLLGRVSDENTSILSRYGIVVDKNASAQDLLNAVDQKFQGQAATFAESDAGKMARMSDKVGELQEQIGYFLIPVLSLLFSSGIMVVDLFANRIVPAFQVVVDIITPIITAIQANLVPILIGLAPILGGVAAALVAIFVPSLIAWTAATYASVAAHVAAAAAWLAAYAPIILILAAVGAAAVLLYEAWTHNFLGIQDITRSVIDFLAPYISAALEVIKSVFQTGLSVVQSVVETVFPIVKTVIETYITLARVQIETTLAVILAVWNAVFPVLQTVAETVFPIIASVVSTQISNVQTIIETALSVIQTVWGTVWPAAQTLAETVWAAIKTAADVILTIQATITGALDTIKTAWDTAWGALSSVVSSMFTTVETTVSGGISTIQGYFDGAGSWLVSAGRAIIQGLIDGITGMLGSLRDTLGGVTDLIPDWKGPPERDRNLLRPTGQLIMQGLSSGIGDALPGLRATLAGVTATIQSGGSGGLLKQGTGAATSLLGSQVFNLNLDSRLVGSAVARDWRKQTDMRLTPVG